MARLARSELRRLLFGPMLGRRKLSLERFDMGFEHSDDLIGERSFLRISEALGVAVDPRAVVPPIRRSNSRPLIVSERLLPMAALRPLADRLGRHAQQFGGLPVGKPLARQIAPRLQDVGLRLIPRRNMNLSSSRSYCSRVSEPTFAAPAVNPFHDRHTRERAGKADGDTGKV
jgi:hypothetical protein